MNSFLVKVSVCARASVSELLTVDKFRGSVNSRLTADIMLIRTTSVEANIDVIE